MSGPVDRALEYIRGLTSSPAQRLDASVTLNFHPDVRVNGISVIDHLVRDGVYRSQFETGVSNGGLSAYRGGERWEWESRIFGQAYDEAPAALRPKYGAINHRLDSAGGSPRFGSCHLRLHQHVLARTTFCYPDSHLQPEDFGIEGPDALILLAKENRLDLDPTLDNYVEAHVHGILCVREDAEAIVLDPSYRGTAIEQAACNLGISLEWHSGFCLPIHRQKECETFRGQAAADTLIRIAVHDVVTPAILGAARSGLAKQTAKHLWHCMVRYRQQD